MSNVVDLRQVRVEKEARASFLNMLDDHIQNGNSVKPIPTSLNARVQALKARAAAARSGKPYLKNSHHDEELLEG